MDNMKIIYRILTLIEKSMDYEEFDMDLLTAERLGITEGRFIRIMQAVIKERYVDGISVRTGADGYSVLNISAPALTVKGMEYLAENSIMKKIANAAKGIKDTIPGL